jgi:protein SCO1/2
VRGVIQELKPQDNEVVIRHEAIPNYMPAMTMEFEVKNKNELNGLATNDQVSFTMIVTETDGWIENLQKVGISSNAPPAGPSAQVRVVRDVPELNVGDKMTNYTFTNSLGEKFSLSELQGQAYAFTFIFTRCPYPTFCPRMNQNFAAAYEELKGDANARTNWHLVSISFDPEFDTPERLKAYSALYERDPKKWSWVTGAMSEIDAIAAQFGLLFQFDGKTINHNLRTVVVNKNGVIRRVFKGNEWKAEELVTEIIAGAEGKPIATENAEQEP